MDWRTNAPKDGLPAVGTYSLEAVRVLDTHRTPIQKQSEMLLCLVRISRRTNCRSLTADMDLFNLIRAPNPTKVKVGSRLRAPQEVPLLTLTAPRVIEMDEPTATDSSGVSSIIESFPLDFAHEAGASDQGAAAPEIPSSEDVPATIASGVGQAKETAMMDPPTAPESRSFRGGKSLAAIQLGLASTVVPEDAHVGVSDPDPSSQGIAAAGDPGSENASSPAEVGSPRSVYRPKWGITNGSLLDTPEACQDLVDHAAPPGYFSELRHMHNEEFLGQYNINLAQQVACQDQRIQARELEIKNLEARLETEAGIKKAAEDKSVGLVKELEHGVEHGQAQLKVESIEAYDPEAETKFIPALQSLKDLKYPLLDQLEGLKDAPMDVIMAALYLESDTGEDTPQYIRDLRPRSSQLTIPVYPEVRDPRNPWAYKEEMKLSDAIAANITRAEKKKKCRIVCRTHGVGSAHHARSDGVLVSVPTVVPQGLALLLVDAATQTGLEDT
nr:hypothetical protein [Tanacetum cinerariifolium]